MSSTEHIPQRRAVLVIVRGRVQGVGFRYEARSIARSLGLTGWVTNLSDGGVETYAEGDRASVDRFVSWLQSGPPGAKVDSIDLCERTPKGEFHSFIVE